MLQVGDDFDEVDALTSCKNPIESIPSPPQFVFFYMPSLHLPVSAVSARASGLRMYVECPCPDVDPTARGGR